MCRPALFGLLVFAIPTQLHFGVGTSYHRSPLPNGWGGAVSRSSGMTNGRVRFQWMCLLLGLIFFQSRRFKAFGSSRSALCNIRDSRSGNPVFVLDTRGQLQINFFVWPSLSNAFWEVIWTTFEDKSCTYLLQVSVDLFHFWIGARLESQKIANIYEYYTLNAIWAWHMKCVR